MYPELLHFGPVVISSYGVMLALAFLAGIFITIKLAERRGIDPNGILNLVLIIMVSAIVGSRLLYVLTHISEFEDRWKYAFLPIRPDGSVGLSGLIFLGGFIAALLSSVVYVKYKKMPFWEITDCIALSLAFGLFLGRIGCFLNGCCFGLACDLPWAVQFPAQSPAAMVMGSLFIHPTQLYSALYNLLIFFILLRVERKKMFSGFLAGTFLVLYGALRFLVDFFRYYEKQMRIIAGLDLNQVISLVMVVMGLIVLISRMPGTEKPVQG
jgi:phosphatidylglycerol:prolipoprotein diacylglycerol transferase